MKESYRKSKKAIEKLKISRCRQKLAEENCRRRPEENISQLVAKMYRRENRRYG